MLKLYKLLYFGVLFMVLSTSCEQPFEDFNVLNQDNRPDIPVTFPNFISQGFNPYLVVSRGVTPSTAAFDVQISIPANSGRNIKNVFIRGGNTALNAASVTGSVTYYAPATALSGLGTTQVTFSSNLTEFVAQAGQGTTVNGTINAANGFNEVAFIFRIVLDDDSEIITTQVRLRISA